MTDSTAKSRPRAGEGAPAARPGGPPAAGKGPGPSLPARIWLWFAIALLVNFFATRLLFPPADAPLVVPYTLFKEEVAKRNVQAIYSRGETLTGRFDSPVTFPPPETSGATPDAASPKKADRVLPRRGPPRTASTFETTLPAFVGPELEQFLIDHGVEISAEPIEEGSSLGRALLRPVDRFARHHALHPEHGERVGHALREREAEGLERSVAARVAHAQHGDARGRSPCRDAPGELRCVASARQRDAQRGRRVERRVVRVEPAAQAACRDAHDRIGLGIVGRRIAPEHRDGDRRLAQRRIVAGQRGVDQVAQQPRVAGRAAHDVGLAQARELLLDGIARRADRGRHGRRM